MVVKQEERVPLSALDVGYLGAFLGLRINELVIQGLEAVGFNGFRESHGYVIQHFVEADRSITELARRMEVTQQAASKVIGELVALGILEATPALDRRSKRIRLSDRGQRLAKTSRQLRTRIEKRLLSAIGTPAYEAARTTLVQCLEKLGGVDRIKSRRVRAPN